MRYYEVVNDITKESAIIEKTIYKQIIDIMDENDDYFFELYFREMSDDEIWDNLIEEQARNGYEYICIDEDDSDEIYDFVFSAQR